MITNLARRLATAMAVGALLAAVVLLIGVACDLQRVWLGAALMFALSTCNALLFLPSRRGAR